jgi:WD40 repeat protein
VKIIDKAGCKIDSMALVGEMVIAGGCEDGKIRVWDVRSGDLLDSFKHRK